MPEHVYYLTGFEPPRDPPAALVVAPLRCHAVWADAVPTGLPGWIESDIYALWPTNEATTSSGLARHVQRLCQGGAIDDSLDGRDRFRSLMRRKTPTEIAVIERNLYANDLAFGAVAEALGPGVSDIDVTRRVSSRSRRRRRAQSPGMAASASASVVTTSMRSHVGPWPPTAIRSSSISSRGGTTTPATRPAHSRSARRRSGERLHALIVEALCTVERLLRPGASAAELDRACRDVLESNDHNGVFPHHSGHGLGVFAQEAPFLVPGSSDTLAVGDVVAVEPGLYVPGVGGLRIEDAWEITSDLPRRLNAFPRELAARP